MASAEINRIPGTDDATGSWCATLDLEFQHTRRRTIVRRRSRGPLTIQKPFYPEGNACHVYVLHPPGGIAGKDALTLNARVHPNAHAMVTTPGAARFYRSEQKTATSTQQVHVDDGTMEWFPQETLFYSGCSARLSTRINLTEDARFIGWDIQCFGRPASREKFVAGDIQSRFELYRNRRPVLSDRLRVGDAFPLQRITGVRGHDVNALFVATPCSESVLDSVRNLIGGEDLTSATTLSGMLLVRYLGDSAERARTIFVRVWQYLRPLLLGQIACPPRIWAT